MVRRVGIAVVGLSLVLSACAGGGEGGLGFLPDEEPSDLDVAAAALDTLVGRWDDRLAFFAVVAAFDAGYSADQVVAAADTLTADGTIPGIAPEGSPSGLLTPLPSGDAAALPDGVAAPRRLVAAGTETPQDRFVAFVGSSLGEVFDNARGHLHALAARERLAGVVAELRDAGFVDYVVGLTILLRASGYRTEEIVEAITLGTFDAAVTSNGGSCIVIPDDEGRPTRPTGIAAKWLEMLCPGVFTDDTGPTSGLDPDCDPAVLGRPLDADERRECYARNIPDLSVALTGPAAATAGSPAAVGLAIIGGRPPFSASIVWGDGFADPVPFDVGYSYVGFAQALQAATHTYGLAGEYTLTVTVTDADAREASATVVVTVAAAAPADHSGRYVGTIVEAVDSDMIRYTANQVVVLVDGDNATLGEFTLAFEVTYTSFSTGGGTSQADCLGVGSRILQTADVAFDGPDTLRGTVTLDWVHHDTGSDCPFGGLNFEREWTGEVIGEFVDGVLHLAFTGSAPDRATETFTVEAPLAAGDA